MQNFVFQSSPAFASKTDDIWYNIHHQYLLIAFYVFKKYAYAVENVTRVGMKLLKPQAILYTVCARCRVSAIPLTQRALELIGTLDMSKYSRGAHLLVDNAELSCGEIPLG